MNFFKYLLPVVLGLTLVACEEDEVTIPNLEEVAAPTALSLDFELAQDNSGNVTIQPGGEGVTLFRIDFGDGSSETIEMAPGESVDHVYTQGSYTVSLEGMGVNGNTTSFTKELLVEFAAPRNLVVNVDRIAGNNFGVEVSASADLETSFDVYFGESDDEDPISFTEGETVQHTYSEVGEYVVRVVAMSGGPQTVEESVTITIANPTLLPLNFEDEDIEIFGFGGANPAIVDNPDRGEANNSSRVVQFTKTAGSEVWAGIFFELGEPLDLSTQNKIRLNVWSPAANVPVIVKLENAADGDIFTEATANTTTASTWEEMTFDFSGADLTQDFSKVVIFFNFGTSGTGENYYFDEVSQTDGLATIDFPLTFEGGIEYPFDAFGGAGAGVVENPDVSAGNNSATVVRFVKEVGSETWGGVFIDVAQPIDFSGSQQVKMKVWSPKVGATILLKFENPDNGDINREVMVNTTTSNAWEELTFNFSGAEELSNLKRVVLFGDFGVAGENVPYYFDDIRIE